MSGQIFISYRREDTRYPAQMIYERLRKRFPQKQIFKDVDSLIPGDNFDEKIKNSVGFCAVLLALIGKRWLTTVDEKGGLRLNNEKDFVRLEIAAALKRGIPVIPVMFEDAQMPKHDQLPPALKNLANQHALWIQDGRHLEADVAALVTAIETVLRNTKLKRQEREYLEAKQREKERVEAQQREKEQLAAEQREKERLAAEQREKERLEAEQRERDCLEAERPKKESLVIAKLLSLAAFALAIYMFIVGLSSIIGLTSRSSLQDHPMMLFHDILFFLGATFFVMVGTKFWPE